MSEDPTQPMTPDNQPTRQMEAGGVLPSQPELASGTQVSSYTVDSLLGRGGMGAVYRATQSSPSRTVALKLMRPGMTSQAALRRFTHEAHLLGRLSHPGIASIHEAGIHTDEHGNAVPFFAMEFVDGPTLSAFARSTELSVNERLALFAKVCDAVHHAHAKGVIHRDLKPSNILVATIDGEHTPKILDFGVARATDADLQTTTMHTDVGQIVGTIPYMSPEQVSGDPDDIDTRSDVYALGVVLYELLASTLPYDLERKLIAEAARIINEDDPSKLSSFDTRLRGDVETIVAKALEKERERRYQSALDLGSDIRRYLSDEPITARPPSAWYQLRKFSKRNKALVSGAAAAVVALLVGLAGTTYGLIEADTQRAIAEREADAARAAQAAAELAQEQEAERARELEQVARFQSDQLAGIDVPSMGLGIRDDLLERVRLRQEASGRLSDDEITQRLGELDEILGGADLTGLALETLEDNIFERAVDTIEVRFTDQPLLRARLLQTIADTARSLGLLEFAAGPQARALEIRRDALGGDHPDTIDSIGSSAMLAQERGDLGDAEQLFSEALERSERVLGDTHERAAMAQGNLGSLLRLAGRFDEAEPLLRSSLRALTDTLGEDHPYTLHAMNNLSMNLQSQSNLDEAERLTLDVLERRRAALGERHPDTLRSLNNAGLLMRALGRLSDAESYLRRAYDLHKSTLGAEHPATLLTLNNLGLVLNESGRYEDAESVFTESLGVSRRVLGDDHPETLGAQRSLAILLMNMGRHDDAIAEFKQAIEGCRRVLGHEHQLTLGCISDLGASLYTSGRPKEAEPYMLEALEIQRRTLGTDHPSTLLSLNNLGALMYQTSRPEEALGYLSEALDVRRRTLGDEHPDTLSSMSNLGGILSALGRLEEGVPLMREAYEARRRVLGAEHPNTLISANNLAGLLMRSGEHAQAEPLMIEVVATARRVLGDTHPYTASFYQTIVRLYASWHTQQPAAGHDESAAIYRNELAEIQRGAAP